MLLYLIIIIIIISLGINYSLIILTPLYYYISITYISPKEQTLPLLLVATHLATMCKKYTNKTLYKCGHVKVHGTTTENKHNPSCKNVVPEVKMVTRNALCQNCQEGKSEFNKFPGEKGVR